MKKFFVLFFSVQFISSLVSAQPVNSNLPSVYLYNPTNINTPVIAEVPTGNLAAPGLIDWQKVHLELDGKNIPFSIREGQAHWKADFKASIKKPAPEDVLVFSVPVPSQKWVRISIVNGSTKTVSVVTRYNGNITATYPGFKVNISERTGMLTGLSAFGESILKESMQSRFFKVGEGVIEQEGKMGPGYQKPYIKLKRLNDVSTSSVQLVSWSSTLAFTEINFILNHNTAIAVGLTYRIYPNKEIEILSDERPWKGRSPWLSYGLENSISFHGKKKELQGFQTYYPYYGFKEYSVSVKSIGRSHQADKSILFELGEEAVNGRFWKRRLAVFPSNVSKNEKDILNRLDEGLVVKAIPVSKALPAQIQVTGTGEIATITNKLTAELQKSGIRVIGEGKENFSILINLSENNSTQGIRGDGFSINPVKNGIGITALTKFGLFKGVESLMKSLRTSGKIKTVSLIASNPVVDLRAGGFGGGPFEVDFPYGNEAEWKRAFDGMMSSGMNIMTDLGMWGNWKMPVTFKYMPELKSNDPEAYDEVSGAKFSSFDSSREFALKLMNYLQDHGVKVWLWVPVGTIPTTFEEKFPEATVPGKRKIPRFTHPVYKRYLESYFKELLETYPVDGFVLIRDDNGGIDDTEEFKQYLEKSKTKDRVWEQYVVLNQLLRDLKFKGKVAIYPYFDVYIPKIEDLISEDFVIVGHGSGIAALSRNFETLGTMGDTWLDNLFGGFRVPSTGRMKRLLADRGSYWIGGAYYGMELSWEALGYFGWQPSASVNSFRYEYGKREFGEKSALYFTAFSDAADNLWEIMNARFLPAIWFGLSDSTKAAVIKEGKKELEEYKKKLDNLRNSNADTALSKWFAHAQLYNAYFDYHLQTTELIDKIQNIACNNAGVRTSGDTLRTEIKSQLLDINDEIYKLAAEYDRQAATVSSDMMKETRALKITSPFKEFLYGYEDVPDSLLKMKQFDASIKNATSDISPGQPFELRIELKNTGFLPWVKNAGHELTLKGEGKKLGLPEKWIFSGNPMVLGDNRIVILKGVTPIESGTAKIKIGFISPFSPRRPVSEQEIELKW